MKKIFLFFIFGIIFTKTSYAVDCSTTNPTIVEHGSTPTTWQRLEGGINIYKTDIYVNTDVSSAVKILYSIGAQSFTPLEFGCSDGVTNVRRTTVGGLPEGSTVNFVIKVYKNSAGTATDSRSFSVVIPSGLVISNVTQPVITYPASYVVGGSKPSVALSFNTNIDSIGSIEVTLPGGGVIGSADYAPFKESAFTGTPRVHPFTMGNLISGTYTYTVKTFYNATTTTPADSRGGNTFIIAPPATAAPAACGDRDQACCATGTCNTGLTCTQRSPAAPVCCPTGFITDSGSGLCVAPTTEPGNSIQVGAVTQFVDNGITKYKVRVTLGANPTPAGNFAGDNDGKWVKVISAPATYNANDVKGTLARNDSAIYIRQNLEPFDLVFTSDEAGQDRRLWATFHNDAANMANNFWPSLAWSIPVYSANVPVPTATAVSCGTSVGVACCATTPKCTVNAATSVFLHCTGTVCSSFRSLVISATDWFNGFTGGSNLYDFDSNGIVGGLDYALWLKAGNSL